MVPVALLNVTPPRFDHVMRSSDLSTWQVFPGVPVRVSCTFPLAKCWIALICTCGNECECAAICEMEMFRVWLPTILPMESDPTAVVEVKARRSGTAKVD